MNRMFTIVMLFGLLLTGLATGCRPPSEIKVEADDSGCEIELKKGQSLIITLEANPTTGYTWELAGPLDEQILRQVGEVEFTPESDLVGAPGVQILRFEAVSVGQTNLELVYHRPWEEGVEPLETFSLPVVVR